MANSPPTGDNRTKGSVDDSSVSTTEADHGVEDPFRKVPKTSLSKAVNRIAPLIVLRLVKALQNRDIESAERLAVKFTTLVMRLDGKHRKRTLSNLELAFPEWSQQQREETMREMYRHFGRVAADFTHIPNRSREDVLSSTEVVGLENLEAAEAVGKGVIAITGHFGNWETMAHWLAVNGRELAVIARDANQGPIQDLVTSIRESAGSIILSRGNAAKSILTRLKENKLIGILPDQNARDIYVPFFGKACGTVIGPATLHVKTQAPILPMFGVRIAPGKCKIIIKPSLKPVPGYDAVEGMTMAINNSLEEVIREYPSQWLWMHDRWKSARVLGKL